MQTDSASEIPVLSEVYECMFDEIVGDKQCHAVVFDTLGLSRYPTLHSPLCLSRIIEQAIPMYLSNLTILQKCCEKLTRNEVVCHLIPRWGWKLGGIGVNWVLLTPMLRSQNPYSGTRLSGHPVFIHCLYVYMYKKAQSLFLTDFHEIQMVGACLPVDEPYWNSDCWCVFTRGWAILFLEKISPIEPLI